MNAISSLNDALDRCQALGMRVSRQRRYILELLWQEREHLSAREIYNRLNVQGKDIGHTSVYQNLEALARHGIVECLDRADGRLYGNFVDPHSHVNCWVRDLGDPASPPPDDPASSPPPLPGNPAERRLNRSDRRADRVDRMVERIIDVQVQLPPELLAEVERQTGVKIVDYRIDFYGYADPVAATVATPEGIIPERELG